MPNQGPRRVPAAVIYLHPFRMIEADGLEPWSTTLDEINKRKWNYVRLHEIAGTIDVGLPKPFNLVVARDGALALPPIPQLQGDQLIVEFFNRCLAALLLGGIYAEAITLENLEVGSIIDWRYVRGAFLPPGPSNRFHTLFRLGEAPPLDAIRLLRPSTLKFAQLRDAMDAGRSALSHLPGIAGEFLLKGTSGVARRDWGTALSNLSIVIEQLTEHIWQRDVLQIASGPKLKARDAQLSDFRVWTTATRQELLFRIGSISGDALSALFAARKARNDLVHLGKHPTEEAAKEGFRAVKELLRSCLSQVALPFYKFDVDDVSLSNPFVPERPREVHPTHWMEIEEIPWLPGELELEREEFEARKSTHREDPKAKPKRTRAKPSKRST